MPKISLLILDVEGVLTDGTQPLDLSPDGAHRLISKASLRRK